MGWTGWTRCLSMTRKRICQPPHSLAYTRSSSRVQRNARASYRRWAASKITDVQSTASSVCSVPFQPRLAASVNFGLNGVSINKTAMDDEARTGSTSRWFAKAASAESAKRYPREDRPPIGNSGSPFLRIPQEALGAAAAIVPIHIPTLRTFRVSPPFQKWRIFVVAISWLSLARSKPVVRKFR